MFLYTCNYSSSFFRSLGSGALKLIKSVLVSLNLIFIRSPYSEKQFELLQKQEQEGTGGGGGARV